MTTLQDILRAEVPSYFERHRVRRAVRWAVRQMLRCRTAALGGHAAYCPLGHYLRSFYNSCKHRACLLCNALGRARWLEAQVRRFSLACDYYHVVFTVPHELYRLWSYNRVLVNEIVLRAANHTLQVAASDPAHLDAMPGMVLSLHTWARNLVWHLHVHVLMTAGGYTPGGWVRSGRRFLRDCRTLSGRFRVTVLDGLEKALTRGDLVIPGGETEASVRAELKRLRRPTWYARVMPRYQGARGVLTYFARYVRGGPFRNHQIVGYGDGRVTLRYRDHGSGVDRTMVLSVDEFLRRVFEHIPERGFRMVRYCGVFAPGKREELAACRRWLRMCPYEKAPAMTVGEYLVRAGLEAPTHCPTCGGELLRCELPRVTGRSPPHPTPAPMACGGSR